MNNLSEGRILASMLIVVGIILIILMSFTSTHKGLRNVYIAIGTLMSLGGIAVFWLN